MDIQSLKRIVEGALLAAGEPLSLNQLNALFPSDEQPGHGKLKQALAALDGELADRAIELTEVASGFRLQIRAELMPIIGQMWVDKPPKYSRALLETLAIIAYRQPITRGEIEQIRGVSLSANILRTLQEREWIRVVGHRDVPGRPELLGTTKAFLDYFNLKALDELPTLAEIKDIDNFEPELALTMPGPAEKPSTPEPSDDRQEAEQDDQAPQPADAEDARPEPDSAEHDEETQAGTEADENRPPRAD